MPAVVRAAQLIRGAAADARAYEALWRDPDPRIPTIKGKHLASLHEIATGKAADLVSTTVERRSNVDWDHKRKLLSDGTTQPWRDLTEMRRARRTADNIRKSGLKATPIAVSLASAGINLRGGPERAIRRLVHIAIAQNVAGSRGYLKTREIAERLGVELRTFYRYQRKRFYPQTLEDHPEVRRIIAGELAKLDSIPSGALLKALLAPRDTPPLPDQPPAETHPPALRTA